MDSETDFFPGLRRQMLLRTARPRRATNEDQNKGGSDVDDG